VSEPSACDLSTPECDRIRARYEMRKVVGADRYSLVASDRLMTQQEQTRAVVRCLKREGLLPVADKHVLEIGCGYGQNLLMLLSLGFRPDHLVGNDLLEERVVQARRLLPSGVRILPGDASQLRLPQDSFDIVFQSMVFTSILDHDFRRMLARRMWELVKPGGGILWYDFAYDNPRNRDVRGVSFREIVQLFSWGHVRGERITLAPPLARLVAPLHTSLYTLLSFLPFLRTHWLCWVRKDPEPRSST
jgi:SAM-dependent methyltransferase